MRNSALTFLASLMAMPLVACTGGDVGGTPDRGPFRDDWRTEADVDFIHTEAVAGEIVTQIAELTIGGRESNDNYANRGDVIVNFDGPANKILVEFRRFTTNTSRAAAEEDFEAIQLWAFNTSVSSPSPPDTMREMNPESDCVAGGWLNSCGVRLYYEGLTQLQRSGADIRVTLPSDYRRTVNIITEDADRDGDYLNRGNVCVDGTNGTVDVEMQSGEAFVIVSEEATPAPICGAPPNSKSMPSDAVASCNTATLDDGTNAAWATDLCGCAMTGEYGVVKVESEDSASTDINIDVPAGLWAAVTVENLGETPDDCSGRIDIPGLILDESVGNEGDWEAKGTANLPSEEVTPGAGYNIQARSGQCGPVQATENPEDFVGVNNGADQETTDRGNIVVANDHLRGMGCEALIP